jgi:beta-glucosidase
MQFPPTFIWGTATAAHQVEGIVQTTGLHLKRYKEDGQPNIKDNQQSGLACDHWNRYPEDITLIKSWGVSLPLLSEWSKYSRSKYIDDGVLSHYSK